MSRAADLLQGRAELLKLARMLGREPEHLAYLETLPTEDLRSLRDAVTAALYDSESGGLNRLAASSRVLPTALTATIAQRAFGPLLSARLAGLLEPDRAVDVSAKLGPEFLADVAVELDPRRASELISRLPAQLIAAVTSELVGREEYVTMGCFVGHLHDDAIAAALAAMEDRDVLGVAFVMEEKDQLAPLLAKLPRTRLAGVIAAAAREGWWLQALDLLNHLSARQRHEIVVATLALDPPAIEQVLGAIIDHELWDEALLIAEHDATISDQLAERLAALPARRRRQVIKSAGESGALERLGLAGATSGQGSAGRLSR
jgi:hypothetical protein